MIEECELTITHHIEQGRAVVVVEVMRRSTGMGGGGVMRAVGRALGAGVGGVKGAGSASGRAARPARVATVSSPSSPSFSTSASGAGWSSSHCFCDGEEWEAVGGVEDGIGFSERFVFGPAPSKEEAEEAVSTLRQIFVPVTFSQIVENGYPSLGEDAADKIMIAADKMQKGSSAELESDWIEPALHLYSSHTSQSKECERVLDAFRLLQINPSIQKMVVSLSSDKAVWDAVMNNEVVQELKKSFYEVEDSKPQSSEDPPDVATRILRWLVDMAKAKMVDFFDTVTKLVNELFHSQKEEKNSDFFDNALRSSFMLSVVVFFVVVMSRIQKG